MTQEIHLVVLVHGLWGTIHHFDYVAGELASKKGAIIHDHPDHPLVVPPGVSSDSPIIVVYRTHSNEGYFTYDGVDVCGARVAAEIENELAALNNSASVPSGEPIRKVTKISIAGYSLGGLISRYAIGLLYKRGVFDTVKPVSYTTFCSPHVGVSVLGSRFSARAFNFVGKYSMSSTSRQLFLADNYQSTKVPLLEYMSHHDSPFYEGLKSFPSHTLYANIINDHRCEYYTSAIETEDPFAGRVSTSVGPYVEGYEPTVLDLVSSGGPLFEDKSANKQDTRATGLFDRLKNVFRRAAGYVFLGVKVLVIVPLWFMAFLLNAAYQTIASSSRQRIFRKTDEHLSLLFNGGDQPSMSEILEDEADEVVESMYETFSKRPQEEEPLLKRASRTVDDLESELPATHGQSEQLPVLPVHRTIIANLNALNWNKYPIHITLAKHSHAAVIVRFPNDKFREGKTVISHWISSIEW
ncbi:putative hydrolase [Sugiyamaella lignohabitans]|uniref:Putative hydrolase n=1 Tax=Sugiyamaella lignohabitans TaxID=796027 RepID=A0A167E2V6_9ASCO|nr:putative hydrolase [Sugiyamaella lignohabitans]ANB13573.1 putative hydrolase [Sugiyamaella lignohabitans]